ncbi:hypothetical protein RND81_11G174300 [Saponaria officinalis]|uniref:La-related protein 6C n=1 Tax=Saponaria officinalis TaxID=3572 RepID=A0AAW1HMD8_SAPOF
MINEDVCIVRKKKERKKRKERRGMSSSKGGGFKLNAEAAEYVPRSSRLHRDEDENEEDIRLLMSSSALYYPHQCLHFLNPSFSLLPNPLHLKIIKQVEYLFSDLSLLANDTMAKHVCKDPHGYVPISVIASMKKIKALVSDHHLLLQALRSSNKLLVSKDGKKVKRISPFTENYKDDLQCRTVMVENLPEDHSYQNLDKIFSVVGSVKAIRLCHPPEATPSRSKNEVIISNKLHALVEYENAEIAEKAVERLNDERNWRKGMRVRVMLRRSPKSVLKGRKSDFDNLTDEEDGRPLESSEEASEPYVADFLSDNMAEENNVGSRKLTIGVRGKNKVGIQQSRSGRGLLGSPTQMPISPFHNDASNKQMNKSPRNPDGTRGFTMGRGKPLIAAFSAPSSPLA